MGGPSPTDAAPPAGNRVPPSPAGAIDDPFGGLPTTPSAAAPTAPAATAPGVADPFGGPPTPGDATVKPATPPQSAPPPAPGTIDPNNPFGN